MTTADVLRAEGYAEGLAEVRAGRVAEAEAERLTTARAQGRSALLLHLLMFRFGKLPDCVHDRVRDASFDDVHAWAERLMFATTLDDVLADAEESSP